MKGLNPVFIPGPTNIPEALRHAMAAPTIDHRGPAFAEMLPSLLADLRIVFGAKNAGIVTFPSSGSGGWEAALANTLSPGDRVLAARHGMFSHKWIDMCRRFGLDVEVIDAPWGEAAPAAEMAARLDADKARKIKAVLVTHNETATGVTSDVGAVRAALDAAEHPALLLVDGVSSIASIPFRMDEWGVDVAVTGSQKGFMLATGLAIVAVSEKAQGAMAEAKLPRWFFDFRDMLKAGATGSYPYTPPTQLFAGLRLSTTMLLEEGLDNVYARHRRIADGVRAAIAAWGMPLCAARPEIASDTVSAVMTPPGFDANRLTAHAFNAYDVSFGVGLGDVAGKLFRIGHLGAMTDVMALSGLAAAEMAMADLGLKVELGSGVAAAQAHYRKAAAKPAERKAA